MSGGYRFGYQGSEKDNEFKGEGNSYTTEFRQLDPRLGRWLTIDPLFAKFPWQSSYTSFDNNPILLIDHLGTETESGPGDGYTKNKDGTRSKTNANGTKTYDAPGFSSVTLPANAKVIGTMQDVDGKIDGAIHNNGVRYQATVGDLARFEINNVEYIAQFSSGSFDGFINSKGDYYKLDDKTDLKNQSTNVGSESNKDIKIQTVSIINTTNDVKTALIDHAVKTSTISDDIVLYLNVSKSLGVVGSAITTYHSGSKVLNQIEKDGIQNINLWDATDTFVGLTGTTATIVAIFATNPGGWAIIATGASIYGGLRLANEIYFYYNH